MYKVLLGVIGNGREDLLKQTTDSLREKVNYPFYKKIMINDAPSYALKIEEQYGQEYHVISHAENKGLSGSIRTLWEVAQMLDVDYIFHCEDDFTFNFDIADKIDQMIMILRAQPHLWQVALKRQPVNQAEAEAGGFMQQNPDSYLTHYMANDPSIVWVEHKNFFTLNPCVYSIDITRPLWPKGGGEKEFGYSVFLNEESACAFLGTADDPPIVNHIGNYRGGNWFV